MKHQAISLACATLAKDPCRKPIPRQRRFGLVSRGGPCLAAAGPFESQRVSWVEVGESRATLKHRLLLLLPLLRFALSVCRRRLSCQTSTSLLLSFAHHVLALPPNHSLTSLGLRLSFLSSRRLDCWLVTDPAQRSGLSSRRYIGSKLNTCTRVDDTKQYHQEVDLRPSHSFLTCVQRRQRFRQLSDGILSLRQA